MGDKVVSRQPLLATACKQLERLHLSLCFLALTTTDALEKAKGVLAESVEGLQAILGESRSATLVLRGIATFRSQVVIAKVLSDHALLKRLHDFFLSTFKK